MGWPIGWTDTEIKLENTNAYRKTIDEALCVLLGDTKAETIQWSPRRLHDFPSAPILQSELYGSGDVEGRPEAQCVCKTCAKNGAVGDVRELSSHDQLGDSPQRPQLAEQLFDEFADPVQLVSYIAASCAGGHKTRATKAALRALRETELSSWCLQHLSDTNQTIWRTATKNERAEMLIEAALGSYSSRCRAQRLKCVGNGVVALAAGCAAAVLLTRAGFSVNTASSPSK